MVTEPGGLTFIAAERGLFVSHPLAEASDPVRLQGKELGAYAGRTVRSLDFDLDPEDRRRIWLACDGDLLVMEPSFFWGMRVATPKGPDGRDLEVNAVRVSGDFLRVHTRAGVFERRLVDTHRPAAPVLANKEPNTPLRLASDQAIKLAIVGTNLRYRLNRHHVWIEAVADDAGLLTIPAQNPGVHSLDIISVGPDLLHSEPLRVELSVDYPRRLPGGWWGALLLFVPLCCLLAVMGVVRGYVTGQAAHSRSYGRAFLSAVAIAIVGLQVLAGLFPHARGWPFVGFSMYAQARQPGDIMYQASMGVLSPRGHAADIPPALPGVAVDGEFQILWPLIDGGEEAARDWAANFMAHTPGAKILGVQARARRRRLLNSGNVEIAPLVLSHAFWGEVARPDPVTER